MLLSVVIPVYNEERTLRELVSRVLESPVKKEIVIVDDGSTDSTREILADLEKSHEEIRVFLQDRNQGKGAALGRGFREARGDCVIIQDADLEYDPAEYGRMIQPVLEGRADVVYGSRFAGGESHRVLYFWHSLGNRFLTMLSNMFTDLNLTDMETCYKLFRKEVLDGLTIEENRFGVEPEITAKIAKGHRWKIYEVGISYDGRTYAEGKKINWKDGVRAIYCILKYNLFSSSRPPAPVASSETQASASPPVSSSSGDSPTEEEAEAPKESATTH